MDVEQFEISAEGGSDRFAALRPDPGQFLPHEGDTRLCAAQLVAPRPDYFPAQSDLVHARSQSLPGRSGPGLSRERFEKANSFRARGDVKAVSPAAARCFIAAEIATGEVSLLQWLARPVRNALDLAFAER